MKMNAASIKNQKAEWEALGVKLPAFDHDAMTAKKEPRSRNPGQTGFLPSTLPILQSSLVRIAIIVIACHNHMVNQTDV